MLEKNTGADTDVLSGTPLLGNRVDRYVWTGSSLAFDRTLIRLRAIQEDAGHCNGFGMAFDPRSGALWLQENGDDSFSELSRIEPGTNGGWVQIAGPVSRIAQYREIETTFGAQTLQQLRWPPTNIATTPAKALAWRRRGRRGGWRGRRRDRRGSQDTTRGRLRPVWEQAPARSFAQRTPSGLVPTGQSCRIRATPSARSAARYVRKVGLRRPTPQPHTPAYALWLVSSAAHVRHLRHTTPGPKAFGAPERGGSSCALHAR